MRREIIRMMTLATVVVMLIPGLAAAHRPDFGSDYDSPERAYVVADPDVSIVLYQPIHCERPQVWLTLDAQANFNLFVQLGLPVLDRLQDYRPSLAVLAPGLPAPPQGLPFDVPDGLGALVFSSGDVTEPSEFFEPFSQTSSWVLIEDTFPLPADGKAYVVAWDPAGRTGKLWVAIGTREDFSGVAASDFIEWDKSVNNFHETGKYEDVALVTETTCPSAETPETGCATLPGTGSAWMAFLVAGLVLQGWRRRNRSKRL